MAQVIEGSFFYEIDHYRSMDHDRPSSSKTYFFGNSSWKLDVERKNEDEDVLSVYLTCNNENKSTLWGVDAHYAVRLISTNPEKDHIQVANVKSFTSKNKSVGWEEFITWEKVLDRENSFDHRLSLKLEVRLFITKMVGIQYVHYDPSIRTDMTDFAFVVEKKKIYVNKDYLSLHSPVFRSMFNSGFMEKTMSEVPIIDVEYEEFVEFLATFQPVPKTITVENVENLLRLADQYDVRQVTWYCERFLITSMEVDEALVFRLADKYKLSEAHNDIMAVLETDEIKELVEGDDYADFSRGAVDSLVTRLLELNIEAEKKKE